MENATPQSRNLGGRPPEFDRQEVLEAAVFAFWSGGFKSTTVGDLEVATGVDRSTLYKSFGGKNGLYETAAEAYIAMATEQLFSKLHAGTDGVEDIVAFLDTLSGSYRAGQPRGCYIVNDMGNVAEYDAAHAYFDILLTGFRAALERAAATGQVDAVSIEPRAQFLTASLIGVNLTHRNRADAEVAHGLLDGIRAEVVSWAPNGAG
ncbi:MAG: helix-turn-helix domain-containing protein [Actinomycetota bacterium]